jgi:hypothetical protein
VGERVWIYLRPGLSVNELQSRVDKIAVACHASTVIIDRASSRTAAFVRVDIKRRDVLGGLVGTPVASNYSIAPESMEDTQPPNAIAALDLGDLPLANTTRPKTPSPLTRSTTPIPSPEPPAATVVSLRPVVADKKIAATVAAGEDLSDWID